MILNSPEPFREDIGQKTGFAKPFLSKTANLQFKYNFVSHVKSQIEIIILK